MPGVYMGTDIDIGGHSYQMKKEFIVKSVDSTGEGSQHVIVSLSSPKDVGDSNSTPPSPFGTKVMGFTNMGDMMKDLNKMLAGGVAGGVTTIKLDIPEYKKMGLSVGDRVFLTMTKVDTLGV